MCVHITASSLEVALWHSLLACGFFSKRIYVIEICLESFKKSPLENVCQLWSVHASSGQTIVAACPDEDCDQNLLFVDVPQN